MFDVRNRFCLNEENIAAKVIDGEAILINLANGCYYSLGGVGGFVWSLIAQRHTLGDIAHAMCANFGVSNEEATADLQSLAAELREEGLILMYEGDDRLETSIETSANTTSTYERPVLAKYSDMAEMFALDPPLPGLADVPARELPERSEG